MPFYYDDPEYGMRDFNDEFVTDSWLLDQFTGETLWSWGNNNHGQLGLGDDTYRSSPVQVGSLTNWKLISCGTYHSLAIKTDGTLWSWGYNYLGSLGLGDDTDLSSPVRIGSLTNWKLISCGTYHSLAIQDGMI
mgnify:CR=1 FL=1